jgi:hypothetical protein
MGVETRTYGLEERAATAETTNDSREPYFNQGRDLALKQRELKARGASALEYIANDIPQKGVDFDKMPKRWGKSRYQIGYVWGVIKGCFK